VAVRVVSKIGIAVREMENNPYDPVKRTSYSTTHSDRIRGLKPQNRQLDASGQLKLVVGLPRTVLCRFLPIAEKALPMEKKAAAVGLSDPEVLSHT
jgi:hypothetical protein